MTYTKNVNPLDKKAGVRHRGRVGSHGRETYNRGLWVIVLLPVCILDVHV